MVSGAENSGLHVFDFLANSILKEVLSAIQKGKPGVFSPGRPTEFLKNYKSSLDFLAYLEGSSPISLIYLFTLRNTKEQRKHGLHVSKNFVALTYLIVHLLILLLMHVFKSIFSLILQRLISRKDTVHPDLLSLNFGLKQFILNS